MADSARTRELARAIEAALADSMGTERYRPAQREVRSGERAHPLEYDRNGFPTPQNLDSFRVRVRRLITGS